MELPGGANAQDDWRKVQGGFRMDYTGAADTFTAQGDAYRGRADQLAAGNVEIVGANALARWQRRADASSTQLQIYQDYTSRTEPVGGVGFHLRTFDLELQQSLAAGSTHRLVWGLGARTHRYTITNSASLLFEPRAETLWLGNVFVQDTIALGEAWELTAALKVEKEPYDRWEPLPDLRLSWRLAPNAFLWASAARAIRAATPFDRNVIERVGSEVFLTGKRGFDPEQVDAYEIGYRGQPVSALSLTLAAFYHDYDDLRTIEPTQGTLLPLHWDNLMAGETYGLDAWAKWQVLDWWRLSPGLRLLRKRLEFKPGASGLLGLEQSGNDPRSQALLNSSMDLGRGVTLDATLRYVDSMPSPALPSYYELNASVRWEASESLEIGLSGFNLLDEEHVEYPGAALIRRGFFAEASWRF
jgi:iron complex outermembrane receptor protein